MHDDSEFSGDCHCGALEAQSLTQLKPPAPKTALVPGPGSCEEHRRCFIKQPAQMVVASSRDMSIIIDIT